jgi:hypothetical protein
MGFGCACLFRQLSQYLCYRQFRAAYLQLTSGFSHLIPSVTMRTFILLAVLFSAILADGQRTQCMQADFSGEASQEHGFQQELGEGLTFSVVPMTGKEEPQWGWFQLKVISSCSGGYVFNPSDANWLLVNDWGSAFIGGPNTDVKAALEYRTRYMIFPTSGEDKQRLWLMLGSFRTAAAPEQERQITVTLNSMRLGQMKFVIEDFRLAQSEPPTYVQWVKFNTEVILAPDFLVSGKVGVSFINCPTISEEVVENIRNPKRHDYFLPNGTTPPRKQ